MDWNFRAPNSIPDFTRVRLDRTFETDEGKRTGVEGGAYWKTTLDFPVIVPNEAKQLIGIIGALRGIYGTINIPAWKYIRTDNIGPMVILSAPQNTFIMSVVTTGAANQQILSVGDMISFAGEMFLVTNDVITDSTGTGTVNLDKRLRNTYPMNTVVEYLNPFCVMQLDGEPSIGHYVGYSSITINFREVIN